jgi:hypothetical protein
MAVWAWTVLPVLLLHGLMWRKSRELLRFQLVLDVVLAVVVGPALVLGADLNTVRCLSRNPPFSEWRWSEVTTYQPTQSDLVLLINPGMEESRRQLLAGRLPLISDRIGGGLPLLANGQTGVWAPVNLPVWALGAERGTTVMALWKLELAALGAFLFLTRGLRLQRPAAAAGAIAFGCGAYQIAWLLVPLGWVIAALPWLWWATLATLRGRPRVPRIVGLGVFAGWLLGCGLNLQTAAVVCGSAMIFGLLLHPRRWRRLAVAVVLAAPLALVQIWPALGYIAGSSRREVVRTQRPNRTPPPVQVRLAAAQQVVVPMVHGHPGRSEWTPVYPYAATATGVGGLMLALVAVGGVRRRYRRVLWAALANLAVAAVLAYRVPPLDVLLVRLPPFDAMTLSRFVVLVPWSLALWGALAADGALRGRRRHTAWWVATVAVLAGIVVLGSPWRLAVFDQALVGVTVLAAAAAAPLLRRPAWLAPALAVELALYAVGINPTAAPSDRLPRPPLVERLVALEAEHGGRVLGLDGVFPANLAARYGLADLRAYDALRPRPYVRMLAELGDPDPLLGGPLASAPAALCGAWSVRFLVTPPEARPRGWIHEWGDSSGSIWRNPLWLPEVRVVGRTVPMTEGGGWSAMAAGAIDFRTAVAVPVGAAEASASRFSLSGLEVSDGVLSARVRCDGPCLLVAARPWAPGWRGLVDREPAPVVRANLAGLGVAVPSGEHAVELRYNPWRW